MQRTLRWILTYRTRKRKSNSVLSLSEQDVCFGYYHNTIQADAIPSYHKLSIDFQAKVTHLRYTYPDRQPSQRAFKCAETLTLDHCAHSEELSGHTQSHPAFQCKDLNPVPGKMIQMQQLGSLRLPSTCRSWCDVWNCGQIDKNLDRCNTYKTKP